MSKPTWSSIKTTNEIKWQVFKVEQYQSKKNKLEKGRTVKGWISQ